MTKEETKTLYDLHERTAVFAENVIKLLSDIKETTINRPVIHQTMKSVTSIGANYMEADVAESKRDFEHKIGICRKEAKETMYWMRMLKTIHQEKVQECSMFYQEAEELVKIFSTIINNSRNNPLV